MEPVRRRIARAARLHSAGRVAEAAQLYRTLLSADPPPNPVESAKLRHLLGFALLQLGRPGPAVGLLRGGTAGDPTNGMAWIHLAAALYLAPTADPERPGDAGDEALSACRRALVLSPDAVDALLQASRLDRTGGAPSWVGRAAVIAPGRADIWDELAGISDHPAAETARRRALCLVGGGGSSVAATRWVEWARQSRRRRRAVSAAAAATRARILDHGSVGAWIESAAAFLATDVIVDARKSARNAAVLAPERVETWANLAEAAYRIERPAEARRLAERGRICAPKAPQLLTNLASYNLALGELTAGWRLFVHRPARRNLARHHPNLGRWNGGPCRRLRVLAEQGLGDELLFSTLWPDLAAMRRGGSLGEVEVELDPRLIPLAARSFPDLIFFPRDIGRPVAGGLPHPPPSPPPATPETVLCCAGDLPGVFRQTLDQFPDGIEPFAVPEPIGNRWRHWIEARAGGRPSIGLCWRSGLRPDSRSRHYPDCLDLAPVLETSALFVALQYDDCDSEVAAMCASCGAEVVLPEDLDRKDDLIGVAGLMRNLDLVISVDTAVLALAGRMGVPALALVLHRSWVELGTMGRPFYPSVNLVVRGSEQTGDLESWVSVAARAKRLIDRKLTQKR